MNITRLIKRIGDDEGFVPVAKWDLKQYSYGFGCRAPGKGATITREAAEMLLTDRVDEAALDFHGWFKAHLDKFNDVREEAFINLVFNMGLGDWDKPAGGGLLSFHETVGLIIYHDTVDWNAVADALKDSKWYEQLKNSGDPPGRARRIVAEVRSGVIA